MKSVGYAFAWDYLGDPAAPARAAGLGLDAVAVAATYHAGRLASPLHPRRRVTEVPRSACYAPLREATWRGRRLAPARPTWIEHDDLYGAAARALEGVGLEVVAWVVLAHDDGLGEENPDLVVRNAFGEPYSHALCPSAEEVRDYGATLASEIVATTSCSALVLEACGPQGFEHSSLHEKTDSAGWGTSARQLLSLCFCAHCRRGMAARGLDAEEVAGLVRGALSGAPTSLDAALGEELAEAVAEHRLGLTSAYRLAVIAGALAARPDLEVTLHASGDRWSTGSFSPIDAGGDLEGVGALVAGCWDVSRSTEEIAGLRERAGGRPVGAYWRVDRLAPVRRGGEEFLARAAAAGMSELHLYHLGLVGADGLERAREVIEWASKVGSR